MNKSGDIGEQLQPKEAFTSPLPKAERPQGGAERSGKYLCLRCGWRWSSRAGLPDPPNACSHCRSAYWNVPPASVRANRPDDPRWKAERDAKADRRRARHLARLKVLARELGKDPVQLVKPTVLPESEELPLRGDELAKIVLADVADILAHDRRLTPLIAYRRLSYNVRVDLRIDNPVQRTRCNPFRRLLASEPGPQLLACASVSNSRVQGNSSRVRVNSGKSGGVMET
jgi:hypothetical protein